MITRVEELERMNVDWRKMDESQEIQEKKNQRRQWAIMRVFMHYLGLIICFIDV